MAKGKVNHWAIAGFVVAVFFGLITVGETGWRWNNWSFAAIALIGAYLIGLGIYSRLKFRNREIATATPEAKPDPTSVSKPHRKDLQSTARKLADTVAHDGNGDFGTTAERYALRGHFPKEFEDFSLWQDHVLKRDVYPKFLEQYIDNDLRRQKVTYPILKLVNFARYLSFVIQMRVDQGLAWDYYFNFTWKDEDNGDVSIPAYGLIIDAAAAQEAGLTTDQCKSIIEETLRNQQRWLETELKSLREAIAKMSPSLKARLEVISTMYDIKGECPSCNQELLSEVGNLPI